jgi:ribonuclease BN (tRNA processing enzyme)
MFLPAMERLAPRSPNAKTLLKHLRGAHASTIDAGRIAQAAKIKNLAPAHFVPGADPSVADEDWLRGVRAHYPGKVITLAARNF